MMKFYSYLTDHYAIFQIGCNAVSWAPSVDAGSLFDVSDQYNALHTRITNIANDINN